MNNTHLSSLVAILLAASLVFFSCTVEETVPSLGIDLERHEVIVTASLDEDSFTRTSLVTDSDEKPVAINWSPGDKIKVFSDGQAAEFTSINEEPTRVARFVPACFGIADSVGFVDAVIAHGRLSKILKINIIT